MSAGTEQRKLAAIMFTDMVGYSALAQRNEALALQLLEEHRGLLRGLFPKHQGTEIKTTGDGFLVEFASALAAVRCAIEMQRALATRNVASAVERQLQVRIGIHVGDVVHHEGDVLGDGVNIAARIEPLAGPGGICISVDVERQIRNAIETSLVKLGPTELKNIQLPMELFRVVLPWEKEEAWSVERGASERGGRRRRRLVLAAAGIAVLILLGAGWFVFRNPVPLPSSQSDTSTTTLSSPLPKSGRITSLAVLPFLNPSGDPEQDYFVDGFTDLLCTELAGVSALKKVTSHTTTMQYKGTKKRTPEIASELGVDAVVEGSVQRESNRVVVSVQLIEGATDRHLWATNYDRAVSSTLKLKMDLARAIAAEIGIKLTPREETRVATARSVNPAALDLHLKGLQHWYRFSLEGFQKAIKANEEAIQLDPNFSLAYVGLADAYLTLANSEFLSPRSGYGEVKKALAKALQLDESSESLRTQAAINLHFDWDWAATKTNLDRALALKPNDGMTEVVYAEYEKSLGHFDEALAHARHAVDLEPMLPFPNFATPMVLYYQHDFQGSIRNFQKMLAAFPQFSPAQNNLGQAYERAGRYTDSIALFEKALQSGRTPVLLGRLGSALAGAGQKETALSVLAELKEQSDRAARTQQGYVSPLHLAVVYAALDDKPQALQWLERAFEGRAFWMFNLRVDPTWDGLRAEPRFQAILRKMNLDQSRP